MVAQRVEALYSFTSDNEPRLDGQGEALESYARAAGCRAEWYTDWKVPGQLGRPAYCGFLTDLRAGRLSRLVVWRLDKLGLSTGGLAELFDELSRYKVAFSSISEGLLLAPGELAWLPPVLNALVFCERLLLGRRRAEVCARDKAAGKGQGGSKPGRLQTVTEEQKAQVAALWAEKKPKAYIARVVGISRPTVYRLLGIKRRRRKRQPRPQAGGQNGEQGQ